jgi:hypothetical protein
MALDRSARGPRALISRLAREDIGELELQLDCFGETNTIQVCGRAVCVSPAVDYHLVYCPQLYDEVGDAGFPQAKLQGESWCLGTGWRLMG